MKHGMRITVRTRDRRSKCFVLTEPPFPEEGDAIRFNDEQWTVTSVEPTDVWILKSGKLQRADRDVT